MPARKGVPLRRRFVSCARLPWIASVMITASERQQKMVEGPVCHACALGTRRDIREAEVNSQQDTRVDDVPCRIREAIVAADLLHCLRRGSFDVEYHPVRAEEQLERA